MKNQAVKIGVIGSGNADETLSRTAYETGRHIAENQSILVCGGLGGVMEAASKGAHDMGGTVMGILPGDNSIEANEYVDIALPTGMGIGRNLLVVRTSDIIIALPGSYGTLSETALALNCGKNVIYLPGAWNLKNAGEIDEKLYIPAKNPEDAVKIALFFAGKKCR